MIPRAAFFKTRSGGLEPYLVNARGKRVKNPPLIIVNPIRQTFKEGRRMAKTIKMHRNRKGQFVARASNPKKHHKKKYKRNFTSAGALVPMNPKKKHYKRNPSGLPLPVIGRVEFPSISTVIGVAGGLVGPPILEGFGRRMMPTTAAQYPMLIKVGAYAAPLLIGFAVGGKKGVRDVLVGEVATFVAQGIQQLSVSVLGNGNGMSGYTGPVPRAQLNGYTGPVSGRQLTGLRGSSGLRGKGMSQYPALSTRFQSRFRRVR